MENRKKVAGRSAATSQASRREFIALTSTLGITMAAGVARAQSTPNKAPQAPIILNVMDVAGDLVLTRPIFEKYLKEKPNFVSRINYTQAPAPELSSKLRAEQQAGRLDMDLILTGTDGVAAGIQFNLLESLFPQHEAYFPSLAARQLPGARVMQEMTKGFALVHAYYPAGPLLEFMPAKVSHPPRTPMDLLQWAKANPNKFSYARPSNSGPGRTFVMGLPYLLGDTAPLDPKNGWTKTWDYLKEINTYIEYYSAGTGMLMQEFSQGIRDLVATTTGFDINPRALGIVPKEAAISAFDGFHWVAGGDFMAIPKGIAADKLAVVLDFMAFVLEPEQQAMLYDHGYLYPGPTIQNVTLDMAPADTQAAIREFGRPEYAELIANHPVEPPLDALNMVAMFRMWDERIGSTK